MLVRLDCRSVFVLIPGRISNEVVSLLPPCKLLFGATGAPFSGNSGLSSKVRSRPWKMVPRFHARTSLYNDSPMVLSKSGRKLLCGVQSGQFFLKGDTFSDNIGGKVVPRLRLSRFYYRMVVARPVRFQVKLGFNWAPTDRPRALQGVSR
ncbi:hypothetical protein BDN72DRAFT_449488 [Pluteus cervinus]|uniref:Uncharacterized protein n=1 Tax=Pluteus cervinus TaxID=181527 RepID=A0ACD3BDJ9_9AGAR|nr:hypothetical protein BDN72DRAFT_449488 [Pluteus cervinus]